MHGLSATGLEPGVTRYDTTGPATIVGAGESAEMRQPVTQITTYRDPQTNAVVEGRVQGQLQNGVFVATPGSTGVFGVAADGRVIVGDGARQTVIAPGQTAASGEITPSSPSLAEALSNSGEQAVVVRPPSSALVNQEDTHTVTLNPGGTLSDIVLLQGRAGNPVTVADLLAANPQYTDVTKIPAGAELNVPVRTGDVLSIYRGSGAVETINTRTAEITSTTQDAQGNTHQVISRPDGDDGRIYIERTLHAGTGEVVSSSAVRVDTMSGQIQPACRGRNRLREKTRSCLCRRGTTHLRPQNEYQRTNGLSDLTGGSPMGYYRW